MLAVTNIDKSLGVTTHPNRCAQKMATSIAPVWRNLCVVLTLTHPDG